MISELNLSRSYTSFWNKTFPFLSRVVRKLNLEKTHYEDYFNTDSEPKRRALVNETGFRLFENMVANRLRRSNDIPIDQKSLVLEKALTYVMRLEKVDPHDFKNHSDNEVSEACTISDRLYDYFRSNEPGKELILSPMFKGCGILDSCYGDVLCGDTLYEIKSGERDFRSTDIKQLFVYCALGFLSKNYEIRNIGLINPRNGIYAIVPLKDAIDIASGRSITETFGDLIDFIDSPQDFN